MSKRLKSCLVMICLVVLLTGSMSFYTLADQNTADDIGEPIFTEAVDEATDAAIVFECVEIPLIVDGNHIGQGYLVNGVTYVPMRAFCEAMLKTEFDAEWNQEDESVYLCTEGLEISMTLADRYLEANGRYLYLGDGAYNINGTIIAPIRELARIFCLDVEWDHSEWSIEIDTSDISIIEHGDIYYANFDLYWLSRVINAESGGEPLEGRIGVGNVVLNRVADQSGYWKDTIKGVIFQPGQFAVVESTGVYLQPNEGSVVAAKICLEGYKTVGESKFFFNPKNSGSSWLKDIGTFYISIANHDFYTFNY